MDGTMTGGPGWSWRGALRGAVYGGSSPGIQHGMDQQQARRDKEEKEIKDRARQQTQLETALETMGVMPKAVAKTKSLEELTGILAGIKEKAAMGEHTLRQKQLEQAVAAQQAQAEADARFAAALNPPGRLDPNSVRPQSIPPLPPTPQDALMAALQNPTARAAAPFLQSAAVEGNPLRQFANETERMRAEAYRRQVESQSLNAALQSWPGATTAAPVPQPKVRYQYKDENGDTLTMTGTQAEVDAFKTANPGRQTKLRDGKIAALTEELKQHEAKIKAGDERYGLANLSSRKNRVVDLKRQLAELGGDTAGAKIPTEWIQYLKDHPESAASFDSKFGPGEAAKHLK